MNRYRNNDNDNKLLILVKYNHIFIAVTHENIGV